jgi:hypothetical protein
MIISIVMQLQDGQPRKCYIPSGVKEFSYLQNVQTGCGFHPASYSIGTGCYFPRIKLADA